METLCFASPVAPIAPSSFRGTAVSPQRAQPIRKSLNTVRAKLDLVPGIPPGEDARDNAPMRYYVPRPVETYDERSFATVLPRTWEGTTDTIGASDIAPITKEEVEQNRIVQVDAAATGAFVEYSQMVKLERQASLEDLKKRSELGKTGRATCGEEEGKAFVSNYKTILVEGVKAVEYWGVPNGAVPRLFGGPGA